MAQKKQTRRSLEQRHRCLRDLESPLGTPLGVLSGLDLCILYVFCCLHHGQIHCGLWVTQAGCLVLVLRCSQPRLQVLGLPTLQDSPPQFPPAQPGLILYFHLCFFSRTPPNPLAYICPKQTSQTFLPTLFSILFSLISQLRVELSRSDIHPSWKQMPLENNFLTDLTAQLPQLRRRWRPGALAPVSWPGRPGPYNTRVGQLYQPSSRGPSLGVRTRTCLLASDEPQCSGQWEEQPCLFFLLEGYHEDE